MLPRKPLYLAVIGILLLSGCGSSSKPSSLSASSTCLEWTGASVKERDAYAPGSVPPEMVTEHESPQYEKAFGSNPHLSETEPAQKITHECEAGRSTGQEPHNIGEVSH
jgi:hypothetical protein